MLQCKSNQLHEILAYANIGSIGISAITNIGVSAYRQKCHIGTPLHFIIYGSKTIHYLYIHVCAIFLFHSIAIISFDQIISTFQGLMPTISQKRHLQLTALGVQRLIFAKIDIIFQRFSCQILTLVT